jgi:hypothetical protein
MLGLLVRASAGSAVVASAKTIALIIFIMSTSFVNPPISANDHKSFGVPTSQKFKLIECGVSHSRFSCVGGALALLRNLLQRAPHSSVEPIIASALVLASNASMPKG